MENIGTKITDIRKRKGLSQEALSDLAKINLRTLQRLEKNETVPHGDTLKRLCNILEINIEDVLDFGKKEDLRYIQFFHLSVLTFIVIPLGNIILPLILWLTKRDKIANLNDQGADLLNFQILWTFILYAFVLSFAFLKFQNIGGFRIPIYYIVGLMYLINIIYPIVVFLSMKNGKIRKYYYSLIQFIKK